MLKLGQGHKMMVENLDDLRKEPRVSSERIIKVSFVNKEQGSSIQNHQCRSQDISSAGLKIVSHFPMQIGSHLPMEIDLGEKFAVINVIAETKWCLEVDDAPTYYIGVKLTKIEGSHLQVWQKFIQTL